MGNVNHKKQYLSDDYVYIFKILSLLYLEFIRLETPFTDLYFHLLNIHFIDYVLKAIQYTLFFPAILDCILI